MHISEIIAKAAYATAPKFPLHWPPHRNRGTQPRVLYGSRGKAPHQLRKAKRLEAPIGGWREPI